MYGGIKSEADAGLLEGVGAAREGALRPLVLDMSKPESLAAAAAKIKAELGKVRACGGSGAAWVGCF